MPLCPRRGLYVSLAALCLAACAATGGPTASPTSRALDEPLPPVFPREVDASSPAVESADLPLPPSAPGLSFTPQIATSPPRPNRYVQGMFGVTDLHVSDIELDPSRGQIVDDNGMTLPMLGGVFQNPLSGDRSHLGIEAGFTFGWQGDVVAVAVGGGGATIAAENDVFMTDLFIGPYVDTPIGKTGRAYLAGGPLLQWANVDLDWDSVTGHQHASDNGFGYGYYVRTGLEFMARPGLWLGFGARWLDASVDMSGELRDLDLEGMQYYLTVTENF